MCSTAGGYATTLLRAFAFAFAVAEPANDGDDKLIEEMLASQAFSFSCRFEAGGGGSEMTGTTWACAWAAGLLAASPAALREKRDDSGMVLDAV